MTDIPLGTSQLNAAMFSALLAEGVPNTSAREMARMDRFGVQPVDTWIAGLRQAAQAVIGQSSTTRDFSTLPEPWPGLCAMIASASPRQRGELLVNIAQPFGAANLRTDAGDFVSVPHLSIAVSAVATFQAALAYVAHGWQVIPNKAHAKIALLSGWQEKALSQASDVCAYWGRGELYNLGISCGPSRLLVLDVDVKGEHHGDEQWQTVLDTYGAEVALTLMSYTPSGGRHFVYRHPEGVYIKSNKLRGFNDIDVRATGAQILVAPSRIYNAFYSWYNWGEEPAPFPDNLMGLLDIDKPKVVSLTDALVQAPGGNGHSKNEPDTAQRDAIAKEWVERACERARDGKRNDTGHWLIRQLRDTARLSKPEAARWALEYWDHVQTIPSSDPYTLEEVQRTIESVYSKPAGDPAEHQDDLPKPVIEMEPDIINATERNDAGNAELLATMFEPVLRFDHRRGKWMCWDGLRWALSDTETEKRFVLAVAKARRKAAARIINEPKRQKDIRKFASHTGNHAAVQACLSLARSAPAIALAGHELNTHQMLLVCANGTLDLETGRLRPSRPEELMTQSTGVIYDPGATCPRWEQFLEEVFAGNKDVIHYVHKAIGYCLTGSNKEQVLFLCHGEGSNGKSTMLSTLRTLLGEYAANAPFSTFEQKRSGDTATNDLAMLSLARLVTSSETSESQRLNEARIKAVTGDSVITCRFLYQEPFDYRPLFKIWLAMNDLPKIAGTDNGIWRRMRLIPFTVSFEANPDKDLDKKLATELPGILAWAMRGCLLWQQEGLKPPSEVVKATQQYRTDNDTLGRFMDDCTIANPASRVLVSRVYNAYTAWCKENGEQVISLTSFGLQMKRRDVQKEHSKWGWRYLGFSLYGVDDETDDAQSTKMHL